MKKTLIFRFVGMSQKSILIRISSFWSGSIYAIFHWVNKNIFYFRERVQFAKKLFKLSGLTTRLKLLNNIRRALKTNRKVFPFPPAHPLTDKIVFASLKNTQKPQNGMFLQPYVIKEFEIYKKKLLKTIQE